MLMVLLTHVIMAQMPGSRLFITNGFIKKAGHTGKLLLLVLLAALMVGCGGGSGGGNGDVQTDSNILTPATGKRFKTAVSSTHPPKASVKLGTNSSVAITFATVMDPTTITTSTVTVTDNTTSLPVTGTVAYTGLTATFTPSAILSATNNYTAVVDLTVKDSLGNPLGSNYTWSFTTAATQDTTLPLVSMVSPANNSINLSTNSSIAVTFSEVMDAAKIDTTSFSVKDSDLATVNGTVVYAEKTAIFTPSSSLNASKRYTVTLLGGVGGIADAAGNELASNYVFSFTTQASADTTAPGVSVVTPALNETGVNLNSSIVAVFSEVMDATTVTTETFTLVDNLSVPIAGVVEYNGSSAIFTPLLPLAASTVYTAALSTTTADAAGNPLAAAFSWSFTTGTATDTTGAEVSTTNPAAGATGIQLRLPVSATFSETMNAATINTATFTLTDNSTGTNVNGTVTYSGSTAGFVPTGNLNVFTNYSATITTGVEDAAGNNQAAAYTWSFTTGGSGNFDSTAPTISSVSPASNQLSVPLNGSITATFSEIMDATSVNTGSFKLFQGATAVGGTVIYNNSTATFTPLANLLSATVYTATVKTGARDATGNNLGADYSWSFTTGTLLDTTTPSVSLTYPAGGTIDAELNQTITVVFTEVMNPETIKSTTFTLLDGTSSPVSGMVSYKGKTATFAPLVNLAASTGYTATINTGVKDTAGNSMAINYTWTFTTGTLADSTLPSISNTVPKPAATGVSLNAAVIITFSEQMAGLNTNTFRLLDSQNTPVAAVLSHIGSTAVLMPVAALSGSSTYTASISSGVKDIAGNPLSAAFSWSFTTGTASDATAPVVSGTSPANSTISIAVNRTITATFSEPVDLDTINTDSFNLVDGLSAAVTGTVSFNGRTAIFTPLTNLGPSELHTATINSTVRDTAGNNMAANYSWFFTTGTTPDSIAPTVSTNLPLNNTINTALDTTVTATFSEAAAPDSVSSLTFLLKTQGGAPVNGHISFDGTTATFTPINSLAPSATYTATITSGLMDTAGNSMAADYSFNFTTMPVPSVSTTSTRNNETGINLDSAVSATFSEAMNPATITTTTYTVVDTATSTPVAGTVAYIGGTALFSPTVSLSANTGYTATITTGATNINGDPLGSNYSWSFTTGTGTDITIPTISDTSPANTSISVAVNRAVSVIFSEEMNPSTITSATYTLYDNTLLAPVNGTVAYNGTTATFTPAANLASNSNFTATITTGAQDLAGNAIAANHTFSFTSDIAGAVDTTPPEVSFANPENNQTEVGINIGFSAIFSEPIDPVSLNSTTVTMNDSNGTAVPGIILHKLRSVIFVPNDNLASFTAYTATLSGDQNTGITDLAGNRLASSYNVGFITAIAGSSDTLAPSISSVSPVKNATGVPINRGISIAFSEVMDIGTISTETLTLLQQPGAIPVAGTVSAGGRVALFRPTASLLANTLYDVTISSGIMDAAGNNMAADYIWSFTTDIAGAADTTAPTITKTYPESSATGLPVNTSLMAIFSEPIDPATIDIINFTLEDAVAAPVTGTVTYSDTSAIFAPTGNLAANTTYTARIKTGLQDTAGNNIAGYVWSFTTNANNQQDTLPPQVVFTSPDALEGNVGLNRTIQATFSEIVNIYTVNSATFSIADNIGTPVAGTISFTDKTAVFTPNTTLAAATTYTATISRDIRDMSGNWVTQDYSWNFVSGSTIDNTAPTVTSTSPADTTTNIGLFIIVSASFDESIDGSTIDTASFTLKNGTTPVTGSVANSNSTITFRPDASLAASTLYTAEVTTAVTDSAGNALAVNEIWTFTTRNGTAVLTPAITDGTSNAEHPHLDIGGANDDIFVVWQQEGSAPSKIWDIWFNRYDGFTGAWGTAATIETANQGDAWNPKIAVSSSGDAVAVWKQNDGTRWNIWSNIYLSGSWGSAVNIESGAGDVGTPRIDMDSSGNAIAIWKQKSGNNYDIIAARYDFATSLWSAATAIDSENLGHAAHPQIDMHPSGNAIAVWQQHDGTEWNIWSNVYTAATTSWGTAQKIESSAGTAESPDIAIDSLGTAFAVWRQWAGGFYNTRANRYASGTWGTAVDIESLTGDANYPQIAVDPAGNAIAVWQQDDGVYTSIISNRFAAGAWGTADWIEQDSSGNATLPTIDAEGDIIATWQVDNTSSLEIWSNRYVASTGWSSPDRRISDTGNTAKFPQVAVDSTGNIIVIWQQKTGSSVDLKVNQF